MHRIIRLRSGPSREGGQQDTLFSATLDLFVELPADQRGAHMSRFSDTVEEVLDEIGRRDHPVIETLAAEIAQQLVVGHAPNRSRYGGNLLPLDAPTATLEELRHLIQALTAQFGLVGLNGVDFVLRETRPVVVEVNPRYSASMELVERATGAAMFALHVAGCRGGLPEVTLTDAALRATGPSGVRGKVIVYAPRAVVVAASLSWMERGVRDVPHPGDVIAKGRPICTVLADGPSRAGCLAELRAAEAEMVTSCVPSDGPTP